MDRFVTRLPDELAEWVEKESDSPDRSNAAVLRDAVRAAAESEGPYADGASDESRVDDLEERVAELEDVVEDLQHPRFLEPPDSREQTTVADHKTSNETQDDVSGGTVSSQEVEESLAPGDVLGKSTEVTDEQLAEIRTALKAGEYAVNDDRVEAVTDVVAVLLDRGRVQSTDAIQVMEEHDLGISTVGQLWSETARELSFVESERGSNVYRLDS